MKLVLYPDETLRVPTKPVKKFDEKLKKQVLAMEKLMWKEKGIGISAQQCGLTKSIIVVYDPEHKKIYHMINPEVISVNGVQIGEEGCLSFPDQWIEVERPNKVSGKYLDINGKLKFIELEGIAARCFVHEVEHLKGILLIDPQENKNAY